MKRSLRYTLLFVATFVLFIVFSIGTFCLSVGFFAIFKDNFRQVVADRPILFPAYMAAVVCYVMFGIISWRLLQALSGQLAWRFSLRTTLIVMTVLALTLGLGAAAFRGR